MAPKKTKDRDAPSGASDLDAVVAALQAQTPRARLQRLAAKGGLIGANAEELLSRSDEARYSPLLLREFFMAIAELETMDARQKLAHGKAQRELASKSAAKERAAEAGARKALACTLAREVSPLVKRQGKLPTARAVKKAAGELRPSSDASDGLAQLSIEQIRNLIFGK